MGTYVRTYTHYFDSLCLQDLCWQGILGAQHLTQLHQQLMTDARYLGEVTWFGEGGDEAEEPVHAGGRAKRREEGQQLSQRIR